MRLVFYCYGIRMGRGLPPFAEELGLMFFQTPPTVGDALLLRESRQPAVIRRVDHYYMVIDVTPAEEVQGVVL